MREQERGHRIGSHQQTLGDFKCAKPPQRERERERERGGGGGGGSGRDCTEGKKKDSY